MNLEDLDRVTLVAGAPSSGKTEFALGMLVAAMRRYGDGNAVMTVSGRQIADALGDRAIRELSAVAGATGHYVACRRIPSADGREIKSRRTVAETVERCGTGCDHPQGTSFACGA